MIIAADEIRILYTGDLGRKNKPIIRDPSTNIPAPDYIFMESTYGNRLHEPPVQAMDDLVKIVNRAVHQKGKIIIPTFAKKKEEMETDICKRFGMAIKTLREQKGISQEKLGEIADLHRTYIGMIERAERNITLKNIDKIAKALDVEISTIFEYIEQKD